MVHNNVKNKTTFDGQPIASFKGTTQKPIPFSNYTAFTVASLSPGKHEVNSDSGVGVYVYSYSSNDSYAWSGNLGIGSFNDPDTIPPKVSTSGSCFDALVTVTDNHRSPIASKISTMKLDSVFNMAYNPDPTYTEGVERDSTSYAMNVIDITKEAYLKVETFDYAGNRTTITSTYTPPLIISTPRIIDYGMPKVGMTDCQYITFTNHGNTSYSYKSIQLYFGNHGFTIDSAGSITAIPAGDSTVMKICFSALSPNAITDTLELSDGCSMLRTLLAAGHIPPDYIAFGENFKCEPVGSVTKLAEASVENISKDSVTIDSIWVDDPIHFGFIANMPKGNNLPFVLSWNGQHFIEFSFMPDSAGSFSTIAHFHSIEAGERTTTLQGCGINPASVNFGNYPSLLSKNNSEYIALSSRLDRGEKISILPAVPNPVSRNGNISVRFAFGLSEPGVLKLSLYDMLGKEMTVIFNKNYASGIYEIRFALPANLPDGNYIYRLAGESNVLSGKLVILH